MPALWQCLTWLPFAVCSLSLALLYKALSVGSGGGSQRLLSPYPRRTKVVLLYSLHCFFLQWSQTVVELMLRIAEEPSSLSWVPISQPQIATGEVPAWGFWPSCHDPPFSFLTLEFPMAQMWCLIWSPPDTSGHSPLPKEVSHAGEDIACLGGEEVCCWVVTSSSGLNNFTLWAILFWCAAIQDITPEC